MGGRYCAINSPRGSWWDPETGCRGIFARPLPVDRRHARVKHYEHSISENCTQSTGVYWSKNHFELLYIYNWLNYLILNRPKFLKFSYISKISMFTSPFEVLPLCFRNSHYLKNVRFFLSFVDSRRGTICHHKDFTGRVLLWENFISPRNNLFHAKKFFLTSYRSPNGPHLRREVQPIISPENPGTTVDT